MHGRRALSGLQLDILSLYRQLLRAARAKGSGTHDMVRKRFRTDVRCATSARRAPRLGG